MASFNIYDEEDTISQYVNNPKPKQKKVSTKKFGRPSSGKKRLKLVNFTVTESEFKLIRKLAHKNEMNMAEFIRFSTLGSKNLKQLENEGEKDVNND